MRDLYFLLLLVSALLNACQSPNAETAEGAAAVTEKPPPAAYALDGRPLYPPPESEASRQRKDSLLAIAEANFREKPNDLENTIWYGRRLAYLSRYDEAIQVYTRGLERFPQSPELYRHRGHRYISTRRFDRAIADFERAAQLAEGRPIEIEPDGLPNKLNIPLSTLQFNIYYHWGLAHYLKGEFERAAEIYEKCMTYSTNPDLLTATTDWLYMTYRRLGRDSEAAALLEAIHPDLEIIENGSYLARLLLYKGEKKPEDLLDLDNQAPDAQLDIVTQGYGVANWHLYNGRAREAKAILEKLIATDYWSAFGYIAAEADLQRI